MTYEVVFAGPAPRSLENTLPEAVAVAAIEFLNGPLTENPYRVGKALFAPYEGYYSARRGQYRIIYQVDDVARTVRVSAIKHRRDAYQA